MPRPSRLLKIGLALGIVLLTTACLFGQMTASPTFPATSVQPSITPPQAATPSYPAPVKRIVGYFTAWGVSGRSYTVAKIPAGQLTTINYAFSGMSTQGECVLGDPAVDTQHLVSAQDSVDGQADVKDQAFAGTFNQLRKLKLKFPDLRVLISIGGWDGSGQFSDAALTDASRQNFVSSCLKLYLQDYPGIFDGFDLDWEFPVSGGKQPGRPADRHNFTLLLAEFRKQLDAQGSQDRKQYLLTMAAPAGDYASNHYELDQIPAYLDWINLMTYDMHGSWDSATNFNAPLYGASGDPIKNDVTVDSSVSLYLQAGIPPEKLNMGVPFYGIVWQGVPDQENGLYQTATSSASVDYTTIKNTYLPASTRYWQAEAQNAWLYDPKTGVMVAYDDPQSVGLKADYVKARNLGGLMIWELSQDGGELFQAIYDRLKP